MLLTVTWRGHDLEVDVTFAPTRPAINNCRPDLRCPSEGGEVEEIKSIHVIDDGMSVRLLMYEEKALGDNPAFLKVLEEAAALAADAASKLPS